LFQENRVEIELTQDKKLICKIYSTLHKDHSYHFRYLNDEIWSQIYREK